MEFLPIRGMIVLDVCPARRCGVQGQQYEFQFRANHAVRRRRKLLSDLMIEVNGGAETTHDAVERIGQVITA